MIGFIYLGGGGKDSERLGLKSFNLKNNSSRSSRFLLSVWPNRSFANGMFIFFFLGGLFLLGKMEKEVKLKLDD